MNVEFIFQDEIIWDGTKLIILGGSLGGSPGEGAEGGRMGVGAARGGFRAVKSSSRMRMRMSVKVDLESGWSKAS